MLLPGYVFTQIARRVVAHVPEATDLRFLLTIITAGTVLQALAFPLWTTRVLGYYLDGQLRRHQTEMFWWAATVCFLMPLVLGILVGRASLWTWLDWLLDKIGLGSVDRMPSAWDSIVREPTGSWVQIHLKDDKGVVAGRFGRKSIASLDPDRSDIDIGRGRAAR